MIGLWRSRREERDLVVLIVDDDPDIRQAVVQALEDDGMIGITAASGQEALRILGGDSTIRLLLTDMMMPGIAGTVLADRAAELRPDLQIMFMTAFADVNRSWADRPVLGKPFESDRLCAAVRAVSTGANRLQQRRAPPANEIPGCDSPLLPHSAGARRRSPSAAAAVWRRLRNRRRTTA